jgi:plastocyanin
MRRARLAGALAPLLLAAAGAPAVPAQMHDHDAMGGPVAGPRVSALFSAFGPVRLDAVAGDTVTWVNDSARAHDVVAEDGSFDSGRMPAGATFARRLDQVGVVPYYCSIHPFMRGEIAVHRVLLDAPKQRGAPGKPYVLTGRTIAGEGGSVRIEGDGGAGFEPAGSAAVAPDGTFRATVVPRTSTSYRAVAADDAGPPVQLVVVDRKVTLSASRRGRATTLTVTVSPAAPGETVVLQLRLRDRFGWWPVQKVKLDHHSTARLTVRRRVTVPGRVLLTLADGATEVARSRSVRIGPFVPR